MQCKYSLCDCKCITAIVFIEVLYCSARFRVETYKTFASSEKMKTKAMMIQPCLVSITVNCVLDSLCDTHLAKLMYLVDKLKEQISDWCSYATKWWEAGYKNKNGRNECDKMVTQQWYTEWKTLINPNLVQHWQSSLW